MSDVPAGQPVAGRRGGPSVMPLDGPSVIEQILGKYKVYKGAGGTLLLFDDQGDVYEPDDLHGIFNGYLRTPHRYALLRGLRGAKGVRELEKVEVTKPPAKGYVINGPKSGLGDGWYWRDPDSGENSHICAFADAVRMHAFWSRQHGLVCAQAGYGEDWHLVGFMESVEYMHVRGGGAGSRELDLLVYCPIGARRQFTLLVETRRNDKVTGAQLVTFCVTRESKKGVEFLQPEAHYDDPRYVVAAASGAARVFKHPLR